MLSVRLYSLKGAFLKNFHLSKVFFPKLKICINHATNLVRSQPKDVWKVYA